MYSLENVIAVYTTHRGHQVTALDNLSLQIKKGEYLSIIGSSGSGKSTLLLTLGGMLTPQQGKVIINEQNIFDLHARKRASLRNSEIGFVFQTFRLIPYLTALENVQVPLFLHHEDENKQLSEATNLLERMGLADRMDHLPTELSVGQQQRVALARMLANQPGLILADEPTGSLDPETGQNILNFLDELHQEGKTIIMVTHDPKAAARAGRTLCLEDGKIKQ